MANLVEIDVRANDKATATINIIRTNLRSLGDITVTPDVQLKGAAETVAEADLVSDAVKRVGGSGSSTSGELESMGASLGKLSNLAMPAVIGAGVALSPIIATLGVGVGGLAIAAEQTISPIMKAASATGGLTANMGSLSPVQQQMAQNLVSLQSKTSQFTQSLQPEVVSVWGKALGLAGGVLGDIQPVAKATGDALGGVIGEIDTDLKTAQWQDFFQFMARTAGPDVKQVGTLFIDMANTLPPILEGLTPIASGLLNIVDTGAKFAGAVGTVGTAAVQTANKGATLGSVLHDVWHALNTPLAGNADKGGLTGVANQINAAKDSAVKAHPVIGTLAGDVAVLGENAQTASLDTKALSDIWEILVGKSATNQQAVLNISSAFDTYSSAVKTSGSRSDVAQQAYLGIISTMGSSLSALQTNGASVETVNSAYKTFADRMKGVHNLTPQEVADARAVTHAHDIWAASVTGLTQNVVEAAGVLKDKFIGQLTVIASKSPAVKSDLDDVADSVEKTGTKSDATAHYRQQLITDLEKSGYSARDAKSWVDRYIGSLGEIPKNVTTHVAIRLSGSGRVDAQVVAPGVAAVQGGGHMVISTAGGAASGRKITEGTGPTADDVMIRVSRGETVVSAATSRKLAPVFAAHGVPGYASGGIPALAAQGIGFTESHGDAFAASAGESFMRSMEKAYAAAAGSTGGSPGNVASYKGIVDSVLRALGQPVGDDVIVLRQMATESGGNPTIVNHSDINAQEGHPSVGLMQVIGGTFDAYAGPYRNTGPFEYGVSVNPAANIYAGLNYATHAYGSQWTSVLGNGHGYAEGGIPVKSFDSGGWLQPGLTLAHNGTGRPEAVGGSGGVHITLELGQSFKRAGLSAEQLADLQYTVRTKGGGSVTRLLNKAGVS